MSGQSDDKPPAPPRYKAGNIGPDGSYLVGKGKPPKHTRFAVGDGRKRGRRPKGQKNFATEFSEEAMRMVTLREGGKERKVTKFRAAVIRILDNAGAKGSNTAIKAVLDHAARLSAGPQERSPRDSLDASEQSQLDEWLEQELAKRAQGATPGDPEAPGLTADGKDPAPDGASGNG